MSNYDKAVKLLGEVRSDSLYKDGKMQKAAALATLALVDEMKAGRVYAAGARPEGPAFLPGDMVGIRVTDEICQEFDGRHGVVVYGPDQDSRPGWLVSSAPGTLRCVAEELTMITRREDRTRETDRTASEWKKRG